MVSGLLAPPAEVLRIPWGATEIYARASTEAKRKALQAAYTDVVTTDLPEWNQNSELLNWLADL